VSQSFRDPDGFVFQSKGRIFRCVLPDAAADVRAFLNSDIAKEFVSGNSLTSTTILENGSGVDIPRDQLPAGSLLLEHPPIPFPNYPYEWSSGMLRTAGELTLRLARAALRSGFVLKDATPYNIMFDGCRPVFLDVLSFRRRDPLESVWRPYAQFVRTFIYPLLASAYFGLRLDEILLVHRDGLEPQRLLALCPAYRRLLPPFLSAITIPALLSRASGEPEDMYRVRRARDPDEATFILEHLFDRSAKLLRRSSPPLRRSAATEYIDSDCIYSETDFAAKQRFIDDALTRWQPATLLDVGCNTGHFSMLAAAHGTRVVAIDRDPDATEMLWRAGRNDHTSVLPLTVDISRPPGASGWMNGECLAFLERSRGKFECILMLALIHHLLVNERVPLTAILDLAAELTTRYAIVEYIDPADPQFKRIVRGRESLHTDVTRENFEAVASLRFEILGACDSLPTRRTYLLGKREL
jgi:SAM-dependent methyltransferase